MTKIKSVLVITMHFLLLFSVSACSSPHSDSSQQQKADGQIQGEPAAGLPATKIDYYKNRYNLKNVDQKLVNNTGDGFQDLYGVRNFRTVLAGVVYRGGANNYYHKDNARDNHNPLPNDGLANLCEEGFGTAVYLYSQNYNTAPKAVDCQSAHSPNQTLNYHQLSPQNQESDAQKVLSMIYDRLTKPNSDPIYLHCWNGWHASGYISAITLMQFCGYTTTQAVDYWNRNTDGVNKGKAYDAIRARIKAFKPYSTMKIDAATKSKVCL